MAVDSIIASPTNSVRVMVAEASGCCASAVSAVATARPSANAGPMQPKPVVRPAMAIEATAMMVMLSMGCLLSSGSRSRCRGCDVGAIVAVDGGRQIDRREDAEDVGLHHPGQQAQRRHDDGE